MLAPSGVSPGALSSGEGRGASSQRGLGTGNWRGGRHSPVLAAVNFQLRAVVFPEPENEPWLEGAPSSVPSPTTAGGCSGQRPWSHYGWRMLRPASPVPPWLEDALASVPGPTTAGGCSWPASLIPLWLEDAPSSVHSSTRDGRWLRPVSPVPPWLEDALSSYPPP